MGDLPSAEQLGLPIKIVVFNNVALGFIASRKKSCGSIDAGTGLDNPGFTAMANAAGLRGVRIGDPADVATQTAEALAHSGPVLVDAVVNRMELAMPPKVTAERAKGSTLSMLKAVMSGRGDEVVELARSNLPR